MQNKPEKLLPSLYGGIVIATISSVPGLNLINCFCCAGIILGGVLSVYFYTRELTAEMPPLSASDGAALGALAGVIAAFLSLILTLVVYALFGNIAQQIAYELIRTFLDSADLPPEFSDTLKESLLEALEHGITPLVVLVSLIRDLFLFTLFGLLGGLLGYSWFKKRTPSDQIPSPAP